MQAVTLHPGDHVGGVDGITLLEADTAECLAAQPL